jgi:hypothetical protein
MVDGQIATALFFFEINRRESPYCTFIKTEQSITKKTEKNENANNMKLNRKITNPLDPSMMKDWL